MKVAFLGLGAMGTPMAANVAKAGHELTVWNRHPKPLDGFVRKPRLAGSIAEAVAGAEAVMTMLADDHALTSVVHGGLLDGLEPGAVHVSMSTIGLHTAQRLATEHQEHGRGYVAAPVLGRPDVAAQGKLWVMAAGEPQALAKVRPLFAAIGRAVTEFGPEPWRANLVKLANNMLLAAMMEAVGEACGLMRKADIATHDFMAVVNGVFNSPVYANYGGMIAAGQYEPALFKARLGLKDLRLALAAGEELGMPLPTAGLAYDNLLSAVALGQGDAEWAALARMAQRRGGLE
jgi:3-hydroxyisobutyrate dehydrogenase-like beta-hydroxyacid dehydrogenase